MDCGRPSSFQIEAFNENVISERTPPAKVELRTAAQLVQVFYGRKGVKVMSLEVSPEIENAIRSRAASEGVSVNELLGRSFGPGRQESVSARDLRANVTALLATWQQADNTQLVPSVPTRPGESPTQALFRQWAEENALMSDEEKRAVDALWENIEPAIIERKNRVSFATDQVSK